MSQAIKAVIEKLDEDDDLNDSDYEPPSSGEEPPSSDEEATDNCLANTVLEQVIKVEGIVREMYTELQELKILIQLTTPEDTFLLHRDDDDDDE